MTNTVFTVAVLLLSVFLAAATVHSADVDAVDISTVDIAVNTTVDVTAADAGVNGIYKNGLWMPVSVQWSCPLPEEKQTRNFYRLVLSSVDSDGVPVEYRFDVSNPKIEKNDGGKAYYRYECYAKSGRSNEPLKVSIQDDNGKVLAEKNLKPEGNPAVAHGNSAKKNTAQKNTAYNNGVFLESVPNERPVYLIIGNEDIGLQGAVAELSLREDRRPLLVKVQDVHNLPQQWFGYEAVDTVVITTTEPEQFAGLTSESPQIKALEQWLKLGGRVLFCAGKNAGQLLEKENSPLRPFLPGKYERMTELRKSVTLETFCGSKRQIYMNGTDEAPYLKMPHFSEPKGIVFLNDLDLPLVSRSAYGFGLIIYFGGDLSGRPLSLWKDRTILVSSIMQWNTEKASAIRSSGSLLQLGYNDISGQVRSTLDKFDGVKILPFSAILFILAIYFLAVGTADWFLVHRILKKPVLTWLTFPLWIILFALLAYFLGTAHRPNKVILNELTLLDTDTETGAVRSSTWAGLYSPKDKLYDLSAASLTYFSPLYKDDTQISKGYNDKQLADTLISWNGLTGSGLGGMSPKTVSPNVWTTKAIQNFYEPLMDKKNNGEDVPSAGLASDSISSVPVQIRSTKSFFAQSWQLGNVPDSDTSLKTTLPFVSSLADEEGIPVGTLSASLPLENVMLIYGRWVLELGNIESNATIEVGKKTKRRELRDLLISPGVLDDQRLQQFAGYNMLSTDLDYITRVLSFYSLLGGFDSTGLHHSFRHNLDMSEVFSADRAVIIGTTKYNKSLSGLIMFDREQNKTAEANRHIVFRQVLPIKLTELSPRLGHSSGAIRNKDDVLAEPDKTIGGQGAYGDPSKGNKPKK
jgi:hypothetical protein